MTYNVHGCVGTDGVLSPRRIAAVIAATNADVAALQELDVGRSRSGKLHQPDVIARELAMHYHFGPAWELEDGRYGNAILSRHPLRLVQHAPLPRPENSRERRGALWGAVELGDELELQVITTHLGLGRRERFAQSEALAGVDWLRHPDCRGPRVFCGDLNSLPGSRVCGAFEQSLAYAGRRILGRTFPSRLPLLRLDHVFVSEDIRVERAEIPSTKLTRVASDHLPLVVDLLVSTGALAVTA